MDHGLKIPGTPRSSDGFSLLEVLVAFSILALSLGVLMQLFSGGMRNTLVGASYSRAVDLAESTLALAGSEILLQPGRHSGSEKDLHWELDIQLYIPEELQAPPAGIEAFRVSARVEWGDSGQERSLSLDTLRLASVRP